MHTILIIGSSLKSLREDLANRGYDYVVLKDVRLVHDPSKHIKRRVVCDFSNHDTIRASLVELSSRYKIDALITTYEKYVRATAFIAAELGLPGMPMHSAEACTDKYLMRELFQTAPQKISPDFAEVTGKESLLDFAHTHSFPLILKPANLAKSLLVTKSGSEIELVTNYEKTIEHIEETYKQHAPGVQPKLVIEEFMEGPIHSVDAFVDGDGTPHVLEQVVDYQTGYDIGFDDNFHYSRIVPSKLSPSELDELRVAAAMGCRALQMRSSPAHIEIIRTTNGPMIVEIGARNGGYRDRMHALAHGIDITGNAIALALGQELSLQAAKNESCAVLELFPKQPGVFSGVSEEKALRTLQSLVYFAIKQPLGTFIGKSADGYKMSAIIILHNADADQFADDLTFINNSVKILTEHNQ